MPRSHPLSRILVRPAEAAELLAISQSKLYAMIQSGELPIVRIPAMRLRVADLKDWAEKKAVEGSGER